MSPNMMRSSVALIGAADPPPPVLSALPKHPVYIQGETVSLACSLPNNQIYGLITFYKDNKWLKDGNSFIYNIQRMDFSAVGTYTCDYWSTTSSSLRSNTITVYVEGVPPAPSITLNPSQAEYFRGDNLTITCSIRGSVVFQYFKDGQEIKNKQISGDSSSYLISTSTQEDAGQYSCMYWIEVMGRRIDSLMSDKVIISVSDLLPAPYITLSSSRGNKFTVTCSLPDGVAVSDIRFYKDSREIQKEKAIDNKTSYTFVTYVQGKYSCRYLGKLHGKPSYFSSQVTSTIKDHLTTLPTFPTSSVVDLQTSKVSTSALPTTINDAYEQITNVVNNTENNRNHLKDWEYYTIGGCLLFIMICVIYFLQCRKLTLKKRKRLGKMPAPLWTNRDPDLKHEDKSSTADVFSLQENENEHTYSTIDESQFVAIKPDPSPKPPITKHSKDKKTKRGTFKYYTVPAISPLSPIYCTDLTNKHNKK